VTTTDRTLAEIVRDTRAAVDDAMRIAACAEDEIGRAQHRTPGKAGQLYHSFRLLRPEHTLMSTEFVYRSHCREILARVAAGQDTRAATDAEIVCALHDVSLVVPPGHSTTGLYFRLWERAFPETPVTPPAGLASYEDICGQEMDGHERYLRTQLTVKDRTLDGTQCTGRHHGHPAPDCPYYPDGRRKAA
jgi:hypothetical protein